MVYIILAAAGVPLAVGEYSDFSIIFTLGGWINYLREWPGLISERHRIAERGMVLLEGKPLEFQERLLEAHDQFSTLLENTT